MIDELKASYLVATYAKFWMCLEVLIQVPKLKKGDQVILTAIEELLSKWPYYGYRRITQELKRKGHEIGETRIRSFSGR